MNLYPMKLFLNIGFISRGQQLSHIIWWGKVPENTHEIIDEVYIDWNSKMAKSVLIWNLKS